MRYSVETDYKLLIRNFFEKRKFVAITASLIAIALSVAGYYAPKKYVSYSTLLIDGQTVIAPLMQGAAVSSATGDWGKIAEEIVFSRRAMTKLMEQLNLIEEGGIRTREDEARLDQLKRATQVSLTNDQYLQISFGDKDPLFAKDVATHLTDIFIQETHGYRTAETEEAFDFIDTQVQQYHSKLREAEERLKNFQIQKLESGASSEDAINDRLDRLQNILDSAELELKEAQIRDASLRRQLTGEARETVSLNRQSQYVTRLQDMEDQLASLRLQYHETYPDIVNLKGQIEDLRRQIRRVASSEPSGDSIMDQSYKSNQVYQGLRVQLQDVETQVATLSARVRDTRSAIGDERRKGEVVHSGEAVLAELSRDYKVNKEIYEDLLKRREAARVSKEIDESQKGLNIKVHEPAFKPLKPAGFRFVHFVAAGVLLGLLVPFALLYAYQMVDRNCKSAEALQDRLGHLPVFGAMDSIYNNLDLRDHKRRLLGTRMLYLITLAVIAGIGYLKLMQVE